MYQSSFSAATGAQQRRVPPNLARPLASGPSRYPGSIARWAVRCNSPTAMGAPLSRSGRDCPGGSGTSAKSSLTVLARHADGVIVVGRLDATNRDGIREVRGIFERAGARIIGSVAVGSPKPTGYKKNRYGYGYGYTPSRRVPAPSVQTPGAARGGDRPSVADWR